MREVAVIGGGIAGAAAARALARGGARCTLLESGEVAGGASGAAAGILQPVTGRRARLAPWHAAGFALGVMLIEAAGAWRCRGVLRVALEDDQGRLWREQATRLPPEIGRWVEADEARERAGVLAEAARGAILVERGGAADIPRLVRWLLDDAEVTVREGCAVTSIAETAAGVTLGVVRGGGEETLRFDAVLVAAGEASGALLRPLGIGWDARRARGELLVARSSHVPAMVLSSGGYVLPWAPGEVLVGATFDEQRPDAGFTQAGEAALRAKAARLLPEGLLLEGTRGWAGVRPATGDRIPRAGLLPGHRRIALCSGLGAKGLLLGLLGAQWSARELLEGRRDLVPPRWRRFIQP